jgi:prepilin-type N-terminal cleavage/methylation domain-containing protein
MRSKKGFTLVELMIVMVIIGILLSLLLPGVFTARQEALKTQVASNLRQIGIALYAYAKNHDGTLPNELADLDPEEPTATDPTYLEGMDEINKNIDGNPFTYNQANEDLYSLNSSDVLVTDDSTAGGKTKATGYTLLADGSVDTGGGGGGGT